VATTGSPAARLITGLAASAIAISIAVVCVDADSSIHGAIRALALAGVGLTFVALAGGWAAVSIPAALSLGAAFSFTRFEQPATVDGRAVAVGVGLLVLCELVAWSSESRTSVAPGVPVRTRAATLAAVAVLAGGVAAMVDAVATFPLRDAVALVAMGGAALALVSVVLLRLLRAATT
jgi:hypothetical protein